MELSEEQQRIIELFNTGENLFITGPGGTGKTFLIRELLRLCKNENIKHQVCAMTGCAALLLSCGARTIHSWSGIKRANKPNDEIIDNIDTSNPYVKRAWKQTKVLIIDEVSMMSRKIFDLLNGIAQRVRKNDRPFGNMQIICVGDFYQLPPVGDDKDISTTQFCFESEHWNKTFKYQIELTHIFRQSDPIYRSVLNEIRVGKISESSSKILQNKVSKTNCVKECSHIYPLKRSVEAINDKHFQELQGEIQIYNVKQHNNLKVNSDTGKEINGYDIYRCEKMSAHHRQFEIEYLLNGVNIMHYLALKKNTRVMCTINYNMENGICNGSQGNVIGFVYDDETKKHFPQIEFDNGVIEIMKPHIWQSETYPCVGIEQLPLLWAWAITIHKIQGATLDCAVMDIGKSVFECGQTYVALSRIRSLDGLHLTGFEPANVKTNKKVCKFYEQLKENATKIVETENQAQVEKEKIPEDKKESKNVKEIKIMQSKISSFWEVKKK